MTHFFTDPQYEALVAICDTLLPSLDPPSGADEATAAYFRRAAADLDLARHFTRAIRDYSTPEQQAQTRQLLDALASPAMALFLTGRPQKFASLPFETREKILKGWSVSPIALLRQAFQGFKRLAHSLYFSLPDENGFNPNWPALRYPGPPPRPTIQPPNHLTIKTIAQESTLDCDVVIVGSGAGGGVAAGVLAQAGHKVIVLEKGPALTEPDFHGREFDSFKTMYENGGVLATEDLGFVILAGSALGGGTTVNWAASFRPPDHLLHEWETGHHLTGFTGPAFQAALDAVCARQHVDADESFFNPQNQALHDGCTKLGYHVGVIPRNVHGCGECGWCCFGCPTGAKQSALRTWLQDASQAGAEIVPDCRADRILIENGHAVGVAATVNGHSLTVRARIVVAAAGALHTPALFLRSGIDNPNIGLNLRFHPTTGIRGQMPHTAEPWRGVMMAAYSDEFADLDGRHYGVKIETPPAHPGLIGFGTSWQSAREYKTMMTLAARQAVLIVLTRDHDSGRVTIDRDGRPRFHYRLSRYDAEHLLRGIEGAMRILVAAGAEEVGTQQSSLPPLRLTGRAEDFEAYLRRMRRAGAAPNLIGLFSAHQMGTCRMGGERAKSVLTHTGESWDVRNLYVADASTFPTSSGVNPMITIQAIAYQVAQHIKTRL